MAWIIGWDLVLEYALGAATVSIGWSGYFVNILHQTGLSWLNIPPEWTNGPHWGLAGQAGVSGYANLPAAGIILVITALLARGTRESGSVNAVIVAIKLLIVLFFIVDRRRAISTVRTTAFRQAVRPVSAVTSRSAGPECSAAPPLSSLPTSASTPCRRRPKRRAIPAKILPFGIIMSLVICTVLYIIVVAILNGMVPFYKLNVAFPVAFAMNYVGLNWAGVVISIGAIAGLTTVLLVMMFGQSRVFFAMSRDGLIPPSFTRIHPTWRTPIFSTVFFGICIAVIAALTPINIVGSLTNMGTLVAFILVSLAVPILRRRHPELKGQFQLPLGPFIIPIASAVTALGLIIFLKVGNPVAWGFFPIVWLWFLIWMAVGLIFYFVYGRHKSTVALAEADRLAVRQPPVN